MTSSAHAEGAPRPTSKLGLGGRVLLAGLIMTTAVPAGVALGFGLPQRGRLDVAAG